MRRMQCQTSISGSSVSISLVLFIFFVFGGCDVLFQDPARDRVLQLIGAYGVEVRFEGNDPDEAIVFMRLDGHKLGSLNGRKDILDEILRSLPDLRELSIVNQFGLKEDFLEHIVQLRQLRTLNFSNVEVGIKSRESLESLAKLPHLEDLKLNGCRYTDDEAMTHLASLKGLKSLELNGLLISGDFGSEESWKQFVQSYFELKKQGLTPTRKTMYTNNGVSGAGITKLVDLRELKHVSLLASRIDDQGLETLRQFPKLTSLDLSYTSITDEGLVAIGQLTELKSLRLNYCLISDQGLKSLAGLTKLEELHLRCASVTDEGIKQLSGCSALRHLDVSNTLITDKSIDVLQKFPQLEKLHSIRTRISLAGMFKLRQNLSKMELKSAIGSFGVKTVWIPSPNAVGNEEILTQLDMISNPNVTDETLATLENCGLLSGLKRLDLSGTSITDEGLRYLQSSKNLQWLELEGTSVTGSGLAYLEKLDQLEYVPIRDSKVTLHALLQLIVTLQKRPLEKVFQIARLNRETGDRLFPTALDLHELRVSDDDLKIIATASEFDTLLLQGNPIGDAGMKNVAKIPQLRQLWVSGGGISGKGLAELKSKRSLETLWFTDTSATEADLETLASMPSLATLNLSGMTFTQVGIDHLKKLRNLETLIVDSSALSPADIEELQSSNSELSVIRSQKRALAAIRGAERTSFHLPEGWHRVQESAGVDTHAMKHPLVQTFGDAHFERADRLICDHRFRSSPKHWKDLPTLKSVSIVRIEHPVDEISALKDIPSLEEVSLYGSVVSDVDLKEMGTLPLVKKLDLHETRVTDASLEYLVRLPQLESLTLGGDDTTIRDAGLQHLAQAKNLKNLDMSRTKITNAGMSHFEGLHELEVLKLREVRIDSGLEHLAGLKNLRELDLYSTLVTDESLRFLDELENLRVIDLSNTMISESGSQRLRSSLPNANVDSGQFSEEARERARPFAKLLVPMSRDSHEEIWMLDFRRRQHLVETLPLVLKMKFLKDLRIGSEGTDEILKRVAEIPSLETLYLWESQVTAPGLKSLHSLPNLKTLYLVRMELASDAFSCFGDFSQLDGLSLSETNICDTDLVFLKKMPQLKYLLLDGTGVTKECLGHLEKLIHLEYLSLKDTKIDPEEVREFEQKHSACKVVFER